MLPAGWRRRLLNLPEGDTEGVIGKCLEPHDLAIAKYVAARDKDLTFNRELIARGIVRRDRLLALLDDTPLTDQQRERVRLAIERQSD